MTYADAVNQLTDGTGTKRPGWGGYVKRTDSTTTTGAYTLTFVNKAGTEYDYEVSASGVMTTSDSLTLDADLHVAMLSDDWLSPAPATQLEAARGSSGTW